MGEENQEHISSGMDFVSDFAITPNNPEHRERNHKPVLIDRVWF